MAMTILVVALCYLFVGALISAGLSTCWREDEAPEWPWYVAGALLWPVLLGLVLIEMVGQRKPSGGSAP